MNRLARRLESPSQVSSSMLLRRGVKAMLRCDEADVISGIARYVVAESRGLSLLSAAIERTRGTAFPPAVAVFGAVLRYLQVRPPARANGAISIAKYGNERAQLEKLSSRVPDIPWSESRLQPMPHMRAMASWTATIVLLPRLMRIARLLNRKYRFYQVLRALELIGFYMRYLRIMESGNYALAAVSNHSNPHGIAFALAAKKCGVPIVLVAHGMPVRPVARLSYEAAIVHCDAARRTYEADGCSLGDVLVHGRRDTYAPMQHGALRRPLRVGVFLCKDVKAERLRELVAQLLSDSRVSEVLIRAHPTNFWKGLEGWVESVGDWRLQLSRRRSVSSDLENTDLVLAGNSSVLIEAVVAGRPAAYVRGLDCGPGDLHQFVAEGLIYQLGHELELGEIISFYDRRKWGAVLRSFANIDEKEEEVGGRFAEIVREIIRVGKTRSQSRT